MNHIVLLANGSSPGVPFLRRALRGSQAFLCTDGAYRAARGAGTRPDWLIGDLDSLPRGTRLAPGLRVCLDDDPNTNDLEKAVRFISRSRFGSRIGRREAWILGALGGRPDQTLANLQVVEKYADDLSLKLVDPSGTGQVVKGRVVFNSRPGETVSLFPIGRARVTTSGLVYRLRNEILLPGSRGLSNRATGSRVELKLLGRAWLFRNRPPWSK